MDNRDRIAGYLLQRFDPSWVKPWPLEQGEDRLTGRQRRRIRKKQHRRSKAAPDLDGS